MAALAASEVSPNWEALYAIASQQGGHFTTVQAGAAGYSPQLLHKYLASRKFRRVRRGIYRIVHFPDADHEDLIVHWLWAEQEGVFSHQTALALHELSDVLPAKIHMTLPNAWKRRRLRVPDGLVLHHDDVVDRHRQWHGVVPLTSPWRTIRDCIDAHLSPDLVEQAIRQARQRGLISKEEENKLSVLLELSTESA